MSQDRIVPEWERVIVLGLSEDFVGPPVGAQFYIGNYWVVCNSARLRFLVDVRLLSEGVSVWHLA